jgi:hypothetical protein
MRRSFLRTPALFFLGALLLQGAGCGAFDGATDEPTTSEGGEILREGPLELAVASADDPASEGAPFSFTASDGTGLRLASVTSDTAIEDPIALTQLHLAFDNPEDRVLEGRFTITLPEGASISRFAMKVGDTWQEAEVVEKQRARVTYEEFLHQRKDPALMEQGAGNEFAVRIFPIAAKERREIAITYAETVGGNTPYRLRLAGLPTIGRIDARVFASGKPVGTYSAQGEAPKGDLVVASSRWTTQGQAPTAMRAGESLVTRVRIPGDDTAQAPIESAVILFDTSASRALDFDRALAGLLTVAGSLAPATPLRVGAFDQDVALIYEGEAGRFDDAAIEKLRARGALGASDLAGALAWAGASAKQSGRQRKHRVIVITDGVATAGGRTPDALAAAARRLTDDGVERVDAVAVGGIREQTLLGAITRGALPKSGVVVGIEEGAAAVKRKLGRTTLPKLEIAVDGATWSHPRSLEGAQPGDEIVVHATVPAQTPARVRLLDHEIRPREHQAAAPLVDRSVAAAKIQSLLEARDMTPDMKDDERRAAIIELSTKHRVVSPHTSLLVLETDADYQRFQIDRTAKVDVLVVQNGQIGVAAHPRGGVTKQQAAAPPAQTPIPAPAFTAAPAASAAAGSSPASPSARGNMWGEQIGDAFGAGGLGLSGIGEGGGGRSEGIGLGSVGTIGHGAGTGTGQGFGSGSGRLGGSHRARPPQVRMGATTVTGRLPPEVIQRIVRQSFGRFRLCYENGLRQNPTLEGRVTIGFTIGRDGAVSNARVASSDLPDAGVASCVQRAFYGLTFPQPEDGIVTVSYPIHFSPDGGSSSPSSPGSSPGSSSSPPQAERGDPLVGPQRPEDPYDGKLRDVMVKINAKKAPDALVMARGWRKEAPGDVLALVALGEAAEASDDLALAARAYGSILELWSYRVDMRRFAGERLERLARPEATKLAADAFEGAVQDRPDHPSSHRLHAYSLLKLGKPAEAFAVLEKAVGTTFTAGRFRGVADILKDDVGIAGAAWVAKEPARRAEIDKRLAAVGGTLATSPTLRFVLVWETDASDVDLHVVDGRNEHAYYSNPKLSGGGGHLVADVTTGYGPEGFIVPQAAASRAYPYKLRVHYYARGAMGFGMGKVEVVEHDGKGGLRFEDRPFVMMKDKAMVDLGEVRPAKG